MKQVIYIFIIIHFIGNFFASASMDQTIRIFDMNSLRQRQILRGHVDSINCVNFHPFFKTLTSASADKTVISPFTHKSHIYNFNRVKIPNI